MAHIVLASASPRRRELLDQIGVQYTCEPQDIDESILPNEQAKNYVVRLAKEKAISGAKNTQLPVLGSDTCVVLNGTILSKPSSEAHAFEMLQTLSGTTHEVMTGVALCTQQGDEQQVAACCVTTKVTFIALTDQQIKDYIATGEPIDKAGSYGIQGKAAVFVDGIIGSYSNVVGLPLKETAQFLQQHRVPIWCE
ncbi:nucleoside triphosphate pyrophosphatase YhdE [Oceaniserpentilla sp. 4NH20-0058]|uniref:Maf family protein n=1 Tax=Oceaniserpentilla sp. 4NH20-0058 TaxID=3127660 RepID=UPI003105BFD7